MQEPQNWRELLGKIIHDPQERQRIANELGISSITLNRWVSGESRPRLHNMRLLLDSLPEYRQSLLEFLPQEFGNVFTEAVVTESTDRDIPSVFYARVMNAHCMLPPILHFSSVCDVTLQQALKQLDPNRLGMEITVVQCMPPGENGKIRSVREGLGRGTSLWSRELEERTSFLGAESLAGYAISTGRALAIQSRTEGEHLFPVQWVDGEESAMASPIILANQIAGCLLVSSTQPHYFVSEGRRKLIQHYAELLVIAFEPEQFYRLDQMALGRMPPYEEQRGRLQAIRQQIARRVISDHISLVEAESRVWKELEQDFLRRHQLDA